MSVFDLQTLLEPISADAPSGPNLEYDPEFVEMERAAQGKAEQQYGSTIIEAEEPDWAAVKKSALDLLKRTHDLRIGMHAIRALLKTDGLPGLRDALGVERGFVEKFWDTVHPQLDPDDGNDPTMRVNVVAALCDNATMLESLRKLPIVSARAAGQFSRRDIGMATGEIPPPPNVTPPKMSLIDAAFMECELSQLRANAQAAIDAVEHVAGLEAAVTKQVGAGNARSLDALTKELEAIKKILLERLGRRGATLSGEVEQPAATQPTNGDAAAEHSQPTRAVMQNWDVDIGSRDDAIRAIDKVCKYFERWEPSSPLPLLLRRAMRLSTKSFLEILRDITPDGLSQAESLGGMTSEEYSQLAAESAAQSPSPKANGAATKSQPVAQAATIDNDY